MSKTILALLASTMLVAPASAQDEEGAGATEQPEAEALGAFAAQYAKAYGVDQAEAERRVVAMANGGQLAEAIADELGDDVAGAYFDHEDGFKMVVRTTRKAAPGRSKVRVRGSGAEVDVDVDYRPGATRNRRAIENILKNQGARLARQVPGVQGLGYDPQTDRIVVDVYLEDEAAFDAAAQSSQLSRIAGMETVVNRLPAPITTSAVRGGAKITSGAGRCTTGFSATRGGVQGMITAAHCGTSSTTWSYTGQDGATATLSNRYTTTSGNHDIAWFKSSATAYGEIFPGRSSSYRTITGTRFRTSTNTDGWFSSGSFICHFGDTSGYSCGEVQKINYRPTYTDGCTASSCNDVFVSVEGPELACGKGDSGGPWFASNTAFGVHSADAPTGVGPGNCAIAIYTSVDWIEDSLGAAIKFGR